MLVINQKLPEKGIIVEEPEVVKIISSYLNNINSINVRGFLINSGKYNGEDFVISTHGIGSPSTAFILEELINNEVKTIIRYGTAGTSDTDFLPVKRGFQALGPFRVPHLPSGREDQRTPHKFITAITRSFS